MERVPVDLLLDTCYALITEGMTLEQRNQFDMQVAGPSDSAELARRKVFAAQFGE